MTAQTDDQLLSKYRAWVAMAAMEASANKGSDPSVSLKLFETVWQDYFYNGKPLPPQPEEFRGRQ